MSAVVKTAAGSLAGDATATSADGVVVFRGIPFAAPPVGDLRFRAPAPVTPWDGVRPATAFGNASVQGVRGGAGGGMSAFGPGDNAIDEDCLYLNLWTPGIDDGQRPVMVWIHGGAFRMGSAGSPSYDGSALARRGDVVVVSLNYRLGTLGFLHSPQLGAANMGLLDQVAALEWVQREVASFGGNPDQVTVFGESAGGKSVECLLAMPAARGLLHRAVLQSTYVIPMDAAAAADRTDRLVAELGNGATHDDLRKVSVDDLQAAEGRLVASMGMAAAGLGGTTPVVDGDVIPELPLDAVAAGRAAGVPVIIGTTLDEARLFGGGRGGLGGVEDETVAAYRRARSSRGEPTEDSDIGAAVMTDRMFRQHSLLLAEAASTHQPTWMYLFTWPSASMPALGACHGIEIPFVFDTLDSPVGRLSGHTPEAAALVEKVQPSWLAFARDGVPASSGLPDWPRYDTERRATMSLGATCEVVDAPMEDERRFWLDRETAPITT